MLPEVDVRKTIADYEALPEGAPYQLIDGDLIMNAAPHWFHQKALLKLSRKMADFVEKHDLGEVAFSPIDVYLTEADVYQPDLVFIAKARLGIIVDGRVKGAPDLVVEVLSPSTGYYDIAHKKSIYESSGVKEYWILDYQEEVVEVFENVNGEFKQLERRRKKGNVSSKILPGFSVSVESLF
jgi:Uma2 family endonuclease